MAIVKAFCLEQVADDLLVLAIGDQGLDAPTRVGLTFLVECVVEGELLDLVKEFLLEVGCRYVIVCGKETEQVLAKS